MHIEIILTDLEFIVGNLIGGSTLVYFSLKLYFEHKKNK